MNYRLVMAGLVPAIHVFLRIGAKDVDARDKRGDDDEQNGADYFPARGGGRSFIDAFSFVIVALKYSSRSLLKRC